MIDMDVGIRCILIVIIGFRCKTNWRVCRGTYYLLIGSTVLNILTLELTQNTLSFIASLQTYDGGFVSASPSSDPQMSTHALPLREAHGGYTS